MKREPIAITGVIAAIITFLAALGLDLDPELAAGLTTVLMAGVGAFQHLRTAPWGNWDFRLTPVAVGAIVTSLAGVTAAFGFEANVETVGIVASVAMAISTWFSRRNSAPA
jgi:hypothetical protein